MKIKSMNFEKELQRKTWSAHYETIEHFECKDAMHNFGHNSDSNKWFVSKYNADGTESMIASGHWKDFYKNVKIFTYKDHICMFGHCTTTKRWFTSVYNYERFDFEDEVSHGYWKEAYDTIAIYNVLNEETGVSNYYMMANKKDHVTFVAEFEMTFEK